MAQREIRYGIKFDADMKSLDDIRKSLDEIRQLTQKDLVNLNLGINEKNARKELQGIMTQISNVDKAMKDAFNPKLNTINVQAFNSSLKQSGTSMHQVYDEFKKAGPAGQAAFTKMTNEVLRTDKALVQTETILDKMGKTLGNAIKWNIASSAINTVTRGIEQAWGYSKALDTSLNSIRVVTGKSADEMDRFAEKANNAAKSLGKTTTDYTDAALIYAQQGLSDREIEARTNITLKTANVTGQSTEKVSEQLTAIWNGYKVSADQAELSVDRLAAVSATTASNLGELAIGMSKVASAASTLGVDEDQLAAQLSTIIAVTKQAPETVGTALRTFYARITDIKAGLDEDGVTLGKYSGEMAKMGINVLDAQGNLRDMGQVVEQVGEKWQTMSREQQIALAQTMGGQRQYSNLVALFDNFDDYTKALNTARNAQGTLQEQQDIYMESTKAHLDSLKAATEDLYDSLADTDSVEVLADGLAMLATTAANFVDAIGGGINTLTLFGGVATNIFAGQIGKGIGQMITKRQNSQSQAQYFRDKQDMVTQMANDSHYSEQTRARLANQQQLFNQSRLMSPETFKQTQQAVEQMNKASASLEGLQKQHKILEKDAESLEQEWKDIGEKIEAAKNEIQALKKKSEEPIKNIDKKGNLFNQIKQAKGNNQRAKVNGESKTAKAYNALGELITNAENQQGLDVNEIQAIRKRYDKIAKDAEGKFEKSSKEVVTECQELANALKAVIEKSNKEIDEAKKDLEQKEKQVEELEEQYKDKQSEVNTKRDEKTDNENRQGELRGTIQENQNIVLAGLDESHVNEAVEGAAQVAGGLAEIYSGITAIHNLGSIISDENLSGFEKFEQVSMSLLGGIGSLALGFVSLSSGLATFSAATAGATGAVGAMSAAATGLLALLPHVAIAVAAVAGITLLVTWFEEITMSAKQAEEQINKTNQAISNFNNNTQQFNDDKKALQQMAEDYEKLSQKAGEYDKNISALTQDEKNRYDQIKSKIISLDETALAYYDAQGNAILTNNNKLQQTIDLLEKQQQARHKELYSGENAKKTDEAYLKRYTDAKNELQGSISQGTVGNSVQGLYETNRMHGIEVTQQQAKLLNGLSDGSVEFTKEVEKTLKDMKETMTSAARELNDNEAAIEITNYFDSIVGAFGQGNQKMAQAEANLQKNNKIDIGYIIGRVIEDYNTGYEQLKTLGIQNAQAFMAEYADGLRLGMEGIQTPEELYEAVDKANQLLASTLNKDSQSFFDYEAAQQEINSAKNYSSYQHALQKQVDNFIKKAAKDQSWQKMSDAMKEQYVKAAFPEIEDINIEGGKQTGAIVNIYSNVANKIKETIQKSGGDGNLINLFSAEDMKNGEIILDYLEKIKRGTQIIGGAVAIKNPITQEDVDKAKQYGQAISNIQEATEVTELRQALNDFKDLNFDSEFETEAIEIYTQKLLQLAEQFENTAEEATAFRAAMAGTNEEVKAAAQDDLAMATRAGQLAAQYKMNADQIEYYARVLQGTEEAEGLHGESLANLAKAHIRFSRAVETADKNLDNWKQTLSRVTEQNKLNFETASQLANAYGDLLDVDASSLLTNPKFLNDADNLKLFENAIKDVDGAWEQLHNTVNNEVLMPQLQVANFEDLGFTFKDIENNFQEMAGVINDTTITPEMDLVQIYGAESDFIQSMNQIVRAAQSAGLDAEKYLSMLGWNATLKESQETKIDTQEAVGWNSEPETTHWTRDYPDGSGVGTGLFGVSPAPKVEQLSGDVTDINTSPQVQEADEAKTHTVPALQIETLHKKSGGKIKRDAKTGTTKKSSPKKGSKKSPKKSKKSGNKGSPTKIEKKDISQSKKDIYREVNEKLAKNNKELKKLQETQQKLYGKDFVKNLQEQNKQLEKQKKLLKQKIELQKQDAKSRRASMQKEFGLKFNDKGEITNYDKIIDKAERKLTDAERAYNDFAKNYSGKVLTDSQKKTLEKLEAAVSKAQKRLDEILSQIKDYDSLIGDTDKSLDEYNEATEQQIKNNIQTFNLQVKLRLDVSQAKRDWWDFKRNVLEKEDLFKGSAFDEIKKDAKLAYSNAAYYFKQGNNEGTVQAATRNVQQTMDEIAIIDRGGTSSIFGKDKAAAMENLKQQRKQLIEELAGFQEQITAMQQAVLDTIDDIEKHFDKQIENYEYFNDLIEHDMNLLQLFYGQKNYVAMDKYYQKLEKNNNDEIDSLKKQAEYWKTLREEAKAAGNNKLEELYNQNWQDTLANLNNKIEESAQLLQNKYTNAIKGVFEELNKTIAGENGLDYLDMEWQLMNQNAEQYLDTINKAYAIQDIEYKYQQALNNSKTAKSQQAMKKLMDEQVGSLRERDKLTQYDVDRAEKMLEIEKARAAMEDAKANKTTMRLRRDSQGNYTYQYVADNSAIEDAEQKLAAAQNELYNFDLERYKSNLSDILSAWKQFQSEYQDIATDMSLNDAEREKKQALLKDKYGEYINGKLQENTQIRTNLEESATEEYDALYGVNADNFEEMTMSEMVPTWDSGVQKMADTFIGKGGFVPACQKGFDELQKVTKEYGDSVAELAKTADIHLDDIKDGVDDIADSFKKTIEKNDDLVIAMSKQKLVIDDLWAKAQKLKLKYQETFEVAQSVIEAADRIQVREGKKGANAAQTATAEKIASGPSSVEAQKVETKTNNSNKNNQKNNTENQVNKNTAKKVSQLDLKKIAKEIVKQDVLYGTWSGHTGKDSHAKDINAKIKSIDGLKYAKELTNIISNSGIFGDIKNDIHNKKITKKNTSKNNKYTPKNLKKNFPELFDTGGYTGTWNNDGRLAILHQKELVLNQMDTKNLLDSVNILRTITASLGGDIFNKMNSIKNGFSLLQEDKKESVEQNVHIEASFPSVNSKREIEEAFRDLVNLAAQRVMRNK